MDRDPNQTRTILRSDELTCPTCVRKIEHQLGRTPGVTHGKVHFATGRIEIVHDRTVVGAQDLADLIGRLGYHATPSPV